MVANWRAHELQREGGVRGPAGAQADNKAAAVAAAAATRCPVPLHAKSFIITVVRGKKAARGAFDRLIYLLL